jgi:glycosyltransferase involved in cell wall biosynthesis
MKILHLCSYPVYSGPLRPTLALALAQQALGHAVHLAWDDTRALPYEESAGPRIPESLHSALPLRLSAKATPMQVWRDTRTLRRADYDVVHCHTSHDHVLARWARQQPLIRTVHAPRVLSASWQRRRLLATADRLILRCHAHIPEVRVDVPCRVIPGGFDSAAWPLVTALERTDARARFGLGAAERVILHAALMADRGQRELLAAATTAGIRALMVGDGPDREALVRAHGDRHLFPGYLSGAALRCAYAASDAAFIARPGNDASARSAQEALAAGLPLLCYPIDALAEFPPSTVLSCDAGIDAAIARWLGGQAPTGGREFLCRERTLEQEARATLDLYEDALRP